jgi:excisionase family DNA binding protein
MAAKELQAYTAAEAAEMLSVSKPTFLRWCRLIDVPGQFTLGNRLFFRRRDFDRFVRKVGEKGLEIPFPRRA